LSIRKFISGRDMDNGLYLSDLASSQQQMAEIKARQGKLQEGLSFAQSALWTRKTLAGVGLEKKDKEVLTLNEILVGDLCNRARRERSACIVDQVSWAPFIFQWEAENRRRFLEAPVQAGACWKEITEAFVTPRR
jgi:hypothetical protein